MFVLVYSCSSEWFLIINAPPVDGSHDIGFIALSNDPQLDVDGYDHDMESHLSEVTTLMETHPEDLGLAPSAALLLIEEDQ